MIPKRFVIDHSRAPRPRLSKAPIIEAVIDIRVIPSKPWDATNLLSTIKPQLPDYLKIEETREVKYQISSGKSLENNPKTEDLGCVGLRAQSNDGSYITQFNKDSFVLSRVKTYDKWEPFCNEARKLWQLYCELLQPKQAIRIGVRFINRIPVAKDGLKFNSYYKSPQQPFTNLDLPLQGFMHHDVIQIPDSPYFVNLIKAVQPLVDPNMDKVGLIIDIDVFLQKMVDCKFEVIAEYLKDMRWIKNEMFFESLTDYAIQNLR